MKKFIPVLLAISLVCFVVPSLAGMRHQSDPINLNVDKNVTIHEYVRINKDLDLDVDANIDPNQWAEVEIFKADLNKGNSVEEIFDNPFACDLNANSISGSFTAFTGIAQVNQSAGSLNNQGNITAVAVTNAKDDAMGYSDPWHPAPKNEGGLAHVEAAVEQVNNYNEIFSTLVTHTDSISGSFCDFTGVAQVNQASGFMNNQNNVVGISANTKNGVVALSDAVLTQSNTENCATYIGVTYKADICSSFNNGTGVAQVNQSPGNMNNQANIVTFSYAGFK